MIGHHMKMLTECGVTHSLTLGGVSVSGTMTTAPNVDVQGSLTYDYARWVVKDGNMTVAFLDQQLLGSRRNLRLMRN